MHSYGTIHHLTCLGTSHQNGRAKQKLHHILHTVRSLILSVKVPTPFLGETALHVVYAINGIPSTVVQNQTPYEHLFGSPPNYHHLRFFSSTCFIFFNLSTINLSLDPGFVVLLAMMKLKRGIGVMILSLIIFMSPKMLSLGNNASLLSFLTLVPP